MCSSSTGALEGHSTHLHVGRSDLHLPLDHRPGGCRWPIRSNTFPCCATKWSRCSHPSLRGGRRRHRRRRRARRGAARGVRSPAHRRAGPRSRRSEAARDRLSPSGTGSRSSPLRSPHWSPFCPSPGSGPLRACSSIWVSAPLSSTGPSGGSRSVRTGPSTCGWTRPAAGRPPTSSTHFRWTTWRRSSVRTERGGCPGASPGPSSKPGH